MAISFLEVKTHTFGLGDLGNKVFLGDYEIALLDFLAIVHYVLTNTDLNGDKDPRLGFVECVKNMKISPGWGGEGKRLDSGSHSLIYAPCTD